MTTGIKKYALAVMLLCLFQISPVSAAHLGPIVFGVERTEDIVFCFSEKDAMFIAKEEERSIAAQETLDEYLNSIEHLFEEGTCRSRNLRYTPRETLYQWSGRQILYETVSFGTMSLLIATTGGSKVYVLTPDEAPPPVRK